MEKENATVQTESRTCGAVKFSVKCTVTVILIVIRTVTVIVTVHWEKKEARL